MELSKLIDQLEIQLRKEREDNIKKVISKLQDCLGVDLYEAAKTDDAITTFNNMIFFLLDKFEDVLYYSLDSLDVESKIFQSEILVSFILSVTRNRDNVEFLKELLMKRGILKDYKNKQDDIVIFTILGIITFRKAEDVIDEETKLFVENNFDILSACHESTLFLLEKNPNYFAVTAFAHKNLNGRYLHSFILDGDYVLDLTGNLYMNKQDYYRLYGIEEIRKVNYEGFLEDSSKCEVFDESKTLFPILRNSLYFYFLERKF